MDALTTGLYNIAIGQHALGAHATVCSNVAIGRCAMGNGVGSSATIYNVAIGDFAGCNLSTGFNNVMIGPYAGSGMTDSDYNIAIGGGTFAAATVGGVDHNISLGYRAAGCCTKTSSMIANVNIGKWAGKNYTGGDSGTNIGYNTGNTITTSNNVTNLGQSANVTGTNQTCISGADVYIEGGAYSDCRAKCCIANSVLGLGFINALTPRSYKWIQQGGKEITEGDGTKWYDKGDHHGGSKRTHYGLLGQEVKAVLDGLEIDTKDFAGYTDMRIAQDEDWIPPRHHHDPETGYEKTIGLRYQEFISPLIKAVQELSAKVEALENA